MGKIIDGHVLAEKIKDNIVAEIAKLKGVRPNLAIILIGEREDSSLYVGLKEREAKKVGIDTHLYKCSSNISDQEVLDIVSYLNKDELVDAILIQLPLPEGLDTDGIILSMDPVKDVDRFHPDHLAVLFKTCDHDHVLPPVLEVVIEMLKSINYNLQDKRVCVVANSDVFGKSLGRVLECRGAKVFFARSDDQELIQKTSKADILITAVGKPKFIKKEMVKKDAVVIDIGITKEDKRVLGDVDFEDVKDRVAYITPVPGGVGPMTIAMAFKNTLEIYKKRHSKN